MPTAGPYPSFDGIGLVLLESPANPSLDVCDIAALAPAAHAAGALVVVDNTTATPLGQRPLDLGADVVVASGTKALTGHSDLMLGYVATRDTSRCARFRTGGTRPVAIPGDFEAWLAHRSLATLDLRLARQTRQRGGGRIGAAGAPVGGRRALARAGRRSVLSVVVRRQMTRVPGVLTFSLPGADEVARFLAAARLVTPATSFGGLHTTADRRAQWGDDTPPGLVRLSCGIEDADDLIGDIVRALDTLGRVGSPNVSTPRKTRIAVVFGGRSPEHAISAVSAGSVLGALDPDEFEVVPVGITRRGPVGPDQW